MPPAPKKHTKDDEGVLDRIANHVFTVRILAALVVIFMVAAAIGPIATVYLLHEPERVAIPAADGSVTITRLLRFKDAFAFHQLAAKQQALAMLNRGPEGIDDQDIIDLCFNAKAKDKLAGWLKDQASTFREYSYHQKAEIASIEIASDPDGSYRARVQGQLIRTGAFNNAPKIDSLKFTLILYLFRNDSAAVNQKYPLGVWNFDYSESR